jgi:hypothetical protein
MEKTLKSFSELTKPGQLLLVDNPLIKDDLVVFSTKHKTHKYSITDFNGRKCRSLGRVGGSIQFEYADQVGDTGKEMIWEYNFESSQSVSYTFKEDDSPLTWNFRLIDETHPKYDKKIASFGGQFHSMMGMMVKMFGEKDLM